MFVVSVLDIPLSLRLPKKTAKSLSSAGVLTVGDLLMVAPRRYYHWGRLTPLSSLREGEDVTILAEVVGTHLVANRSGSGVRLEVSLTDGVQFLSATFFAKSRFRLAPIETILSPGQSFLFAGKVGAFRGKLQLTHPSFEGVDGEDIERIATRPIPIYPSTGTLTSWAIARAIAMVLDHLDEADVPDVVPACVRERFQMDTYARSLRLLHQPETDEDYQQARRALAFTEAFILQAGLASQRLGARSISAVASPEGAPLLERLVHSLPFELTQSQNDAACQISADLAGEVPMRRLLQGDVGSGKTVVALIAFLQVSAAGHQCAFVAPTEVLAEQHTASLRALLAPLGPDAPDVRLLTGSTTPAERREIAAAMASSAPLIVVGTHALFQDGVRFADLALVVVDEQHRFGVEQRAALRGGRQDGRGVHEMVMTATPIPRTIAMTVFGDLDETRMGGMPAGRAPIATYLADAANTAWVERTWERAAEEIAQGRRVYVVCPRIDASDEIADVEEEGARPLASVEEVAAYLRSHPALAGVAVHELTGRTPTALKGQIMEDFSAGRAPLLVATTVIEVGVDVPEATLMVILDAQQFGLAQLHQLRGRVGRSSLPSLCIALHRHELTDSGLARLQAFARTTDGFELAEADLRLRKEGDVLGAGQSGSATHLRFLSVRRDEAIIRASKSEAETLLAQDPTLSAHPDLARALREASDGQLEWMQRS
ncbi:ATP-dependent DNA helicase RecG [Actinomyces bouchesdurhonensis]|uniref:ATP-dependent DNA helicase RecG n=1 Tax=Actinomyces bouchesdurhonensis TaxID=1852361 RepID=UPI0023F49A6C|nr:ATP-dependent DNA helicase RecG [Actinomyces bouchesdurhonensis]